MLNQVQYDKNTKKATGVEVLDSETNLTYEFKSKIIFYDLFFVFPAKK